MDKDDLVRAFSQSSMPSYTCPHCESGKLTLVGNFETRETLASQALHQEDWWDPDYVVLYFQCSMQCGACRDYVTLVGAGGVEREQYIDENGNWDSSWVSYYKPSFFQPALKLITIPESSPYAVKSLLDNAFALFFFNPGSCCNCIRMAGEQILTELGVEASSAEKRLNFSDRIKALQGDHEAVKRLFDAIRWLGNHGSHPGDVVTHEDAYDALKIMEYLLAELYCDRKPKIEKLVAAINERKGPLGRARRGLDL